MLQKPSSVPLFCQNFSDCSLLSGSPKHILDKLQKGPQFCSQTCVQSSQARHIKPLLQKLHWLPVVSRIQYKVATLCYNSFGGGDSLVVRAPDSWLKGRGFESLLERRENFLLQGRLSVLTLISVSVPPRVTTVARKKSRSFCQKCRWQVTAKHAYTLRMWILLNRASALVTTCP